MRILVVEDEPKIASAVKRGLEQQSYAVDVSHNGDEGLAAALSVDYDLLILDRMLPGTIDGTGILKAYREAGQTTPVLFLTAKDKVLDKTEGLNLGADDYLVKPFAFVELLARVRALLRRTNSIKAQTVTYDDLELDTTLQIARRAGQAIELSTKEYALLEYLMSHPNRVLSKQTLIDHVWNFDTDILPNTVEVYIGYLRNKIDKPFQKQLIHTRRGFGYVFGDTPV